MIKSFLTSLCQWIGFLCELFEPVLEIIPIQKDHYFKWNRTSVFKVFNNECFFIYRVKDIVWNSVDTQLKRGIFLDFMEKTKFEFYNRKNSNHIENKYMIIFTVGPVSLIGEI